MRSLAFTVLLALPISAALGGGKESKDAAPTYDPDTVVTITAIVTEVRELPKGDPLDGVNLTVKVKGETLRVYVAPVAFVKLFGVTFKKNDVLEIAGSKVTFEGSDLILARQLTLFRINMVLRDQSGKPFWLSSEVPTGD